MNLFTQLTRLPLITLFVLGYCTGVNAQEQLTLEAALRMGMAHNLDIKIGTNAVSTSQNLTTAGNAGFLPVIDVSASSTRSTSNVRQQFLNDSVPREIRGAQTDVVDLSPGLSWRLFDGLGMFATYQSLQQQTDLDQTALNATINQVKGQITISYFRVVLEQKRLAVARNSVDLSAERMALAKTRYEVGKASKLEYLGARVDYNTDRSALLTQEEALFTACSELNRLLGRQASTAFFAPDDIQVDTALSHTQLTAWVAASNYDIQVQQQRVSLSDLQVKSVKADRLPTLDFDMNYNYNRRNSDAGFLISNRTSGLTYGLTARVSIMNGLGYGRRLQNAQLGVEAQNYQLQNIELQVFTDVENQYKAYTNSLQLMVLEQANLEVARENAAIARDRYKLGSGNALELREAQENAAQAELRLINTAFNAKVAETTLLQLAGQLL